VTLPAGALPYRRTTVFDEGTVPPGLLKAHRTKDGAWGLIKVLEGKLAYRITDPARPPEERVLEPGTPGIVEPMVLHEVEPLGPVLFYVEFHKLPD
jgi:tellurite resistance-related uncharacterized protein